MNGYRMDIIVSGTNGEYIGWRMVVGPNGPGPINGGQGHPTLVLRPGDTFYSDAVSTRITATAPTVPPEK